MENTKYELLPENTLGEAFGDFGKCEGQWRPLPEEMCRTFVSSAKRVCEQMGYSFASAFEWERAEAAMESGKVLHIPIGYIRARNGNPKCPLCGASYEAALEAISRADGKTHICPECGTKEALESYSGFVGG